MPTTSLAYTDLTSDKARRWDCYKRADDVPTVGKGKIFFKYNGMLCQCDLSPGAKLESVGFDAKKLIAGHVRLLCPECVMEERPAGALHINYDNAIVYVHDEDPTKLIQYRCDSNGTLFCLPTFTVDRIVSCDYREPTAGSCTWRAHIVRGCASRAPGGGTIFAPSSSSK